MGTVTKLPPIDHIPSSRIPLQPHGQQVYDEWCKDLLASGKLTVATRDDAEFYAVMTDQLDKCIANGMKNSRGILEAQKSARIRLGRAIDPENSTPQTGAGEATYAHFGFARRARQEKHNLN